MTETVNDANFEEAVIKSSTPVLVDFWAEWCGPCRQLAPVLTAISTEMAGTLKIAKMNIDESQDTPSRLGVRGIPTLMLFKNGALLGTKVGALPKSALTEWINSTLSSSNAE